MKDFTEEQQEGIYREFIRFRSAFEAVHHLLRDDLIDEAKAVVATCLDSTYGGKSEVSGGYLGEFLLNRYTKFEYDPEAPEMLQILPRPDFVPKITKASN